MDGIALHITLESATGRIVTLARTSDRRLLIDAARAALLEAAQRATEFAEDDPFLGEIQRGEVRRLQKAMELAIPELRVTAGVM
jgi:hypothetical protein